MFELEWEQKVYKADGEIKGLRESCVVFELPDGRLIKPDRWFPTKPPRPLSYELVGPVDDATICIKKLEFVRELEKKEEVLTKREVTSAEKSGRIKKVVVLEFSDFLAFCGKRAFDQYISDLIISFGKKNQTVFGELTDIKYKVVHAEDQKFVLEVDASIHKLGE